MFLLVRQIYKKNIAYIILYRNFAWRNKQNSEMKKILVAEDTESNFLYCLLSCGRIMKYSVLLTVQRLLKYVVQSIRT